MLKISDVIALIQSYTSKLKTEINTKQDTPSATGTAGQVLGLDENLQPEWKTVSGGGVVDSSLSTSSENPVQNKIIAKEINDIEDKRVPVYEEVAGKYINQSGSESSSNAFARSKPIQVEKGELIVLKATGYETNVSMITKTNEEGTSFQAKVYSIDSTERTYSYFVEENGYIIISYKVSGGASHTVTIYGKNASSNMVYRIDGLESLPIKDVISAENLKMVYDNVSMTIGTQGKYILANGNISTSANFNMSTGIQVPAGGTIRFTTRGYNNEVAVLAKVNGDNTYSPLVISIDSTIREYYYSTTEAITVVISTNKNMTPVYSVSTSRIIENEKRISDLEDDVVAFSTMGIIGDSLASGASNYTGGVSDRPLFSWGKFIEREHGIAVSLFSKGGFTTRTWQTHSAGLTALQSANALDCYVLALGVNDAYDLGSAYLGTISDVHVGDESLNADTFYGNYSKIISEIKAKSARAKIFCITIATETNQTRIDYNVAIKAVANLYTNVYLIDLSSDDFYDSARFTETWVSAHSTAVGYKMIAKNIYDHIRDVVRSNLSDFLDIQWIVEDHP